MTHSHTLSAIEASAPISLSELMERAALQTRVDRKYLVPRRGLESVLNGLEPQTRVLEIDGVRGFEYESVYFDTPDLTSYLSAAHKRRKRFKIRTRSYLDSRQCYLEVKTRGGRSLTVKDRLSYDPDDADTLTAEGRQYTDGVLADAGIVGAQNTRLGPTLTTQYQRSTLYVPSSDSRATVDVGLTFSLDEGATLSLPHLAIVETKSGSTPSAVDRLLWANGHRPASFSKYATGLAALRPELPSNKWARILRTSFSATVGPNSSFCTPKLSDPS
ncbi:MAG TPA: polyphosphate polymerase domain-containing protein [Glaciihabitans sp.]|nr:polyphosphate polymerase domain-containing protein [Glaciihabitans sp.]